MSRYYLTLAALFAVLLLAILQPELALRGWLAGFVWAAMLPMGALTLLLVHRITGGEWGQALSPVLESTARSILPVAVLAIPILLFSQPLYRWTSPEISPAVAAFYLNAPLFALRSIVALSLWSTLAWIEAARSTTARAAVGLIAMAIAINIIPADWILSAQAGFHSSGFGFGFLVESVLAVLALCAIFRAQDKSRKECRDLAGLIAAALLGTMYFVYMQFVVIWYGNLPETSAWYIVRSETPWRVLGSAAFLLGAVLPFLALLHTQFRESGAALNVIAASILCGVTLHMLWLIVPNFGVSALAPSAVSIALAAALMSLWLHRRGLPCWADPPRAGKAPNHG